MSKDALQTDFPIEKLQMSSETAQKCIIWSTEQDLISNLLTVIVHITATVSEYTTEHQSNLASQSHV